MSNLAKQMTDHAAGLNVFYGFLVLWELLHETAVVDLDLD